jgi:hypothetical protein
VVFYVSKHRPRELTHLEENLRSANSQRAVLVLDFASVCGPHQAAGRYL